MVIFISLFVLNCVSVIRRKILDKIIISEKDGKTKISTFYVKKKIETTSSIFPLHVSTYKTYNFYRDKVSGINKKKLAYLIRANIYRRYPKYAYRAVVRKYKIVYTHLTTSSSRINLHFTIYLIGDVYSD